jgi:hypothetical protein
MSSLIYKWLKGTTIQLTMNSWSGGTRIPPVMITVLYLIK